jgi:hypothetical protein
VHACCFLFHTSGRDVAGMNLTSLRRHSIPVALRPNLRNKPALLPLCLSAAQLSTLSQHLPFGRGGYCGRRMMTLPCLAWFGL